MESVSSVSIFFKELLFAWGIVIRINFAFKHINYYFTSEKSVLVKPYSPLHIN
jgi:hypothetical protein